MIFMVLWILNEDPPLLAEDPQTMGPPRDVIDAEIRRLLLVEKSQVSAGDIWFIMMLACGTLALCGGALARRREYTFERRVETHRKWPSSTASGLKLTDELLAQAIPARESAAKPNLVDLTPHYNVVLTQHWYGLPGNDLAELPRGIQTFVDVEFDVRGVVQLGSLFLADEQFPEAVKRIVVRRRCQRIHFLHAAVCGRGKRGTLVGSYLMHYASGDTEEFTLKLGEQILDWWERPHDGTVEKIEVAWKGTNEVARSIRLFKSTWENPQPDVPVNSIDFLSAMNDAAPFLVAISAEDHTAQPSCDHGK
ncbi:MAG: hypothetical protein HY735_24665 [Verrucomicrobia bacterium]|nr:hypothetical protein [Verrucomicrobiota bacterium]